MLLPQMMRRPLRETRAELRSRRRYMYPARQFPADRDLAVSTLQDDRAEGDPTDHLHVGAFLEPEARELAPGGRIIDRLDSGPAANRYAVDPHPSLRVWGSENGSQPESEGTFRTRQA
jgi:hypothetical protein